MASVEVPRPGDDVAAVEAFLKALSSKGYVIKKCEERLYLYDPSVGIYRDVTDKRGMRRLIGDSELGEYSRSVSRMGTLLRLLPDWVPEESMFLERANSARKIAFADGYFDFVKNELCEFAPDVVFFSKRGSPCPERPVEEVVAQCEAPRRGRGSRRSRGL